MHEAAYAVNVSRAGLCQHSHAHRIVLRAARVLDAARAAAVDHAVAAPDEVKRFLQKSAEERTCLQ